MDPGSYTGLPSQREMEEMKQLQEENKQFLNIPRRSVDNVSLVTCLAEPGKSVHSSMPADDSIVCLCLTACM